MANNIASANKRLPDFLIIGAAKSGTTSLYQYLLEHPGVFMPEIKEPCFFDEAVAWKNGIDWYMSLFALARDHQICGEASTNYTRWPQVERVPEKIKAVVPQAKLIYVMRDPVRRAYSHYTHRWSKELHLLEPVSMGFMEFIKSDPMCIDSSKYSVQIREYLKHFPLSQLLLVVFEDLIENPSAVMNRVFHFLDLDPVSVAQEKRIKANSSEEILTSISNYVFFSRFKRNPLYILARLVLPRGLKKFLYEFYASISNNYRKTRSLYSFLPLTISESEYMYSLFLPYNIELRDAYGVDISKWELKAS